MPEAELRAFLRVFIDEERIEESLDAVALMGLEIEATDPLELFVLAHLEVQADPRVSIELEAAVLVEEVGLDPIEVAAILGIEEHAVAEAVARSLEGHDWSEPSDVPVLVEPASATAPAALAPEAPHEEPVAAEEAIPADEAVAADAAVAAEDPVAAEEAGPADAPAGASAHASFPTMVWPPTTVRQTGWVIGVAAALVLIGLLAGLSLSEAGRARLQLRGIDPLVALLVVVGLIGGGIAFLRAASTSTAAVEDREPDAG